MAEEPLEPSAPSKLSPSSERASADGITSPEESPSTPSKKNKRKSSEPRRRSDLGVKRFRLDPDAERDAADTPVREFPPDTPETVLSAGSIPDPEERISANRGPTPVPPQIGWYSIPIGSKVVMPSARKGSKKQQESGKPQVAVPRAAVTPTAVLSQPLAPVSVLLPGAPAFRASPSSTSSNPGCLTQPDDDEDDEDSPTFLDPLTGRPTRRSRKNYKNMTRERRVEANARERSRVHTISAAFESLRRAVPSYSYNQKLSKLAILRIACSYIMALSKLANVEICEKANNFSFIDCVDLCTQTIQTEGRARRRH